MVARGSLLSLLLVFAALLCTGCNPAQKIVGVWEMDTQKSTAALAGSGPMAAMLSAMTSQLKMEIDFKADGKWSLQFSMPGTSTQSNGTWRFVKQDGQTLTLAVKAENETTEREMLVKMLDDNNIELMPPGIEAGPAAGKTMPMRRVVKK